MNFLETLGVILIVETLIEAILLYKYRFVIRQLFHVVSAPRPVFVREPSITDDFCDFDPPPFTTPKQVYRDMKGRFCKPSQSREATASAMNC